MCSKYILPSLLRLWSFLFVLFYLKKENLVARFKIFYHHCEQVKKVCHMMALIENSDFFFSPPPKEKKNKKKVTQNIGVFVFVFVFAFALSKL